MFLLILSSMSILLIGFEGIVMKYLYIVASSERSQKGSPINIEVINIMIESSIAANTLGVEAILIPLVLWSSCEENRWW